MGYVILWVTDPRQRVRIRALTGLGMGGHRRGIDLLRWAYATGRIVPISENARSRVAATASAPGMVPVNGPGFMIVPPGPGCDADCIYRPGLEAARIGQWNRGSDHYGGRGRLLRTERRKRANSEPIRGDIAPRCRLAPLVRQSCPRGRHRGRDTMCER